MRGGASHDQTYAKVSAQFAGQSVTEHDGEGRWQDDSLDSSAWRFSRKCRPHAARWYHRRSRSLDKSARRKRDRWKASSSVLDGTVPQSGSPSSATSRVVTRFPRVG